MAVNWGGVAAIIVFYLLILVIGIYAAWKKRHASGGRESETAMVGARDISLFVGCFTMTATWVGGGYINGTAEFVYTPGSGLVWTQAPYGYAIALVIGGVFFAKKMRDEGYVTMLDPLQNKLGRRMGGILYLPALLGELLWSGAILAALGSTISVIADVDRRISVIISACIALLYTVTGGLYSVAYTDVVQLICIFVGLWISIPFALVNENVAPIDTTAYVLSSTNETGWLGTLNDPESYAFWIDSLLLLMFGGIPWQVYFQRVLAAESSRNARMLSFIGAFGCIIMAIPPIIIGAIGSSADWTATSWVPKNSSMTTPAADGRESDILPLVMQYLTPPAVSFVGLGAVSAAVMSSTDSSILSVSSMFTRNIYNNVFRQKASERELKWVMRFSILVMGGAAMALALTTDSIYELWYLCSDFVYVILFPQLTFVIYGDPNTYGSLFAFIAGVVFRLGGGEPTFDLDPFIPYGPYVPWKTVAMLISLVVLVSVSWLFKCLFEKGIIPAKYDIFDCKLAYGGRSFENPRYMTKKDEFDGADNIAYDETRE